MGIPGYCKKGCIDTKALVMLCIIRGKAQLSEDVSSPAPTLYPASSISCHIDTSYSFSVVSIKYNFSFASSPSLFSIYFIFTNNLFTRILIIISKIQLVVYHQCCILIG